jgi:hypothetical protein
VIEPIFEADFLPCSFGFRPRRSQHDALQVLVDEAWDGRRWVAESDISNCFVLGTLLRWYREEGDIEPQLPLLSTFLGHVEPKHTFWYFEATPELLALAPPIGWNGPGTSRERERMNSDRARAAAAGVLHRTSRPAARRQPTDDRRLPRQLPAAVDLQHTGKAPSRLQLEDLDAATITALLAYLKSERGNSVRTRNARLTAIHSFFHYTAARSRVGLRGVTGLSPHARVASQRVLRSLLRPHGTQIRAAGRRAQEERSGAAADERRPREIGASTDVEIHAAGAVFRARRLIRARLARRPFNEGESHPRSRRSSSRVKREE